MKLLFNDTPLSLSLLNLAAVLYVLVHEVANKHAVEKLEGEKELPALLEIAIYPASPTVT